MLVSCLQLQPLLQRHHNVYSSEEYDDIVVECIELLKHWHLKHYHRKIDEDLLQEAVVDVLENRNKFHYQLDKTHVLNFLVFKYRLSEHKQYCYYARHPLEKSPNIIYNGCNCSYNNNLYDLKVISRLINKMSKSKRRIILLTVKGYKVEEIAKITCRTAKGIKSQLSLIRKYLAQAVFKNYL